MKLKCKHCGKLLTTDLYPVKPVENSRGCYTNLKDIYNKDKPMYSGYEDKVIGYDYGDMKKGVFYITKLEKSWNNKYDEDLPAQIVKRQQREIVVGQWSILESIIPPFKQGYGCCNYSMGNPLICECGTKLGEMYLDCYESKHINFIEKNVIRYYK